jgi:hypothetical protein
MPALTSAPSDFTPLTSPLACRRIRGNGEVISRQDFMERHERMQAARLARLNKKPKRLASQGKDVAGYPLLQVGGWESAPERAGACRAERAAAAVTVASGL